jgi:hypothetical protein
MPNSINEEVVRRQQENFFFIKPVTLLRLKSDGVSKSSTLKKCSNSSQNYDTIMFCWDVSTLWTGNVQQYPICAQSDCREQTAPARSKN